MTPREQARQFWVTKGSYPYGPKIKERRLHEVNYLVPRLKEEETISDLGCGDGSLIRCLNELLDVKWWFAADLSSDLMDGLDSLATTAVIDLYGNLDLPKTDVTIMAGVLPFIFDDVIVDRVLGAIQSPRLLLRTPCTILDNRVEVNEFSEALGEDYAAIYRTLQETIALIDRHFMITSIDRVYPDEIESIEFDTRQFYFEGHKWADRRGT